MKLARVKTVAAAAADGAATAAVAVAAATVVAAAAVTAAVVADGAAAAAVDAISRRYRTTLLVGQRRDRSANSTGCGWTSRSIRSRIINAR